MKKIENKSSTLKEKKSLNNELKICNYNIA